MLPGEQAKNVACNTFMNKLYASAIHISLLTVEEAIHRIYFKGHIRRMAKQKNLEHSWKRYRSQFPTEFGIARTQGIQDLRRFVAFLKGIPARYIDANTFLQKSRHLSLVAKYARLVLEKYDTVEPMDTFHFAIMRINRIDWYVTAEEHLGAGFDEFSVLTL
jgi:hypothetical protein